MVAALLPLQGVGWIDRTTEPRVSFRSTPLCPGLRSCWAFSPHHSVGCNHGCGLVTPTAFMEYPHDIPQLLFSTPNQPIIHIYGVPQTKPQRGDRITAVGKSHGTNAPIEPFKIPLPVGAKSVAHRTEKRCP